MNKGRKVAIVATALALGLAGAAGAAHTGMLSIPVGGGGSPEASGIQVRGKWSLVVRNRAGKVVARRRFENALTTNGVAVITGLLSGAVVDGDVAGGWSVKLDDQSTAGHGCNLLVVRNPCIIGGSRYSGQGGDLTVSTLPSAQGIKLDGQVTPPAATAFRSVETLIKTCDSLTEAHDCWSKDDATFLTRFTAKTLGSPLQVAAGQTVQVHVQITFS